MIITSVQHIVDYVRDNLRTRIYRTVNDPVTMKEYVTCEVYTVKGIIDKSPDKGNEIDIKS